ncbi:amino-acid N-acetyltransferase [Alpinimonas psychrophila]|uniref:Amino-acid N-acetyltransferase n=1 Tax=Alpinimonas psychrophila TaxID=748908 RepID=A0A7W3JVA0_9MICO|nr:amino-acid N-acetyltransferase [Alpinimonas psychrophila]MBA8829797.1 amino-acid N-acetyltransferase [Alpinimonas psychrophila]
MAESPFIVRRARTADVPWIQSLAAPLVAQRILLGKENVSVYEAVQEFRIVEDSHGTPIGCGALHVMWQDLGEVRTLAVDDAWLGKGVGHAILLHLEKDARKLGLSRLFCLTFEVDFFTRHGFTEVSDEIIAPEVYAELARSNDEGVAEFLDLARVKPNTLGNTRMLRLL